MNDNYALKSFFRSLLNLETSIKRNDQSHKLYSILGFLVANLMPAFGNLP